MEAVAVEAEGEIVAAIEVGAEAEISPDCEIGDTGEYLAEGWDREVDGEVEA